MAFLRRSVESESKIIFLQKQDVGIWPIPLDTELGSIHFTPVAMTSDASILSAPILLSEKKYELCDPILLALCCPLDDILLGYIRIHNNHGLCLRSTHHRIHDLVLYTIAHQPILPCTN